jgi:hypothetical protein
MSRVDVLLSNAAVQIAIFFFDENLRDTPDTKQQQDNHTGPNSRKEEFEDTNGGIRILNRRTENRMSKRKRTKEQTTIYKTLHQKLKIE